MNVKHDEQKNQKENFLQAQLRAKQLVVKEKEEKERQSQKVINCFKEANKIDLFETTATLMKNQNMHIGPSVDFSYYKLNLEFLKRFGICLEKIDGKVIASDSCARIIYTEYYIDYKNACIIRIKYHLKHVRIYSDNGKNDLMTYTFVNNKNEIYYYDEYSGNVLVKSCKTNMGTSDAEELLKDKVFKITPYKERTFELISDGKFEKKSIEDIHTLPQKLLEILLKQYKDSNVSSGSKLQIETKFIGIMDPTTVQSKVEVNFEYSGVIQTTEKLLNYQISLYFKNFPEKKVIANFYLTENEKNRKSILPNNLLKKITLENVKEKLKYNSNLCKNFYQKYLIDKKRSPNRKHSSFFKNLAKVFYQNIKVEDSIVNFPKLKDTYKGISIEYFKVDNECIQKSFSFAEQIRESRLEYDGKDLKQSIMYAVVYNNQLYLIELYATYQSYIFDNSFLVLRLPAFTITDININIFKPFNQTEIDIFVGNIKNKKLVRESTKFFGNSLGYNELIQRNETFEEKNLQKIFPDFTIQIGEKVDKYKVENVQSDIIYMKILDCITTLRNEESIFSISKIVNFWSYNEENETRQKIPFISNGIEYGHYFYNQSSNERTINSPLKKDCDYSYSSADDLFYVVFDNNVPYFKTTFHSLSLIDCYGNSLIENTSYHSSIGEFAFWDECIKYLIYIQNNKKIV